MTLSITNTVDRDACWITWERHQRSRSLAEQLQIPLIELSRKGGRAARYLFNTLTTLRLLVGQRRSLVFAQVPSLVLGHLVIALGVLMRFRVIADAHNAVIEGAESGAQPLRFLYRLLIRRADAIIVTNSALADRVRRLGGCPYVLPDPVPSFRTSDSLVNDAHHVVVVSTWAEDEPLESIIKAADLLPEPLFFTITGRPRGKFLEMAANSPRLRVSGFLSDEDYVELLQTSRAIVDLTTREDCLVCGAYEALAVGRPLIVSDSRALRELLRDGAVFCANEPEEIANAVACAVQSESEWAERCVARRDAYIDEWRAAAAVLMNSVASI